MKTAERRGMLDGRREEDRRIYERSVRLLFLMALRDVAPEAGCRFEHSLGRGVFVTIRGTAADRAFASRVETRMREITAADLPIRKRRVSREEAAILFGGMGREDTVRLLAYRPFSYLDVTECSGYSEFFYGALAPSTGEIRQYALQPYYPGLVIRLPDQDFTAPPAPLYDRPGLMRAYRRAGETAQIAGCRNAADLNEIWERGEMRTLIRVAEEQQQLGIAKIARRIAERGSRVVFVSGPSSSGKTTFANRLGVSLRVCGLRPISISLDDYYRNREEVPLDVNGKPDLESPEAIDIPLFAEQLLRLLEGQRVEVPRYSFATKMREAKGRAVHMNPEDVLLVEGIHGLNPALSGNVPRGYQYLIYVSALTALSLDDHNRIRATDARLLRRMVRDQRTRGSSVTETMEMWDAVRAGEERYIYPYQENADVFFDTSLVYEIPILKKYAYALLSAVPEEYGQYTRIRRLVKFLNYFRDSQEESEIPPTSILREFIGGCTFY